MIVSFVVLGQPDEISGGHLYNKKIAECNDKIKLIFCDTINALKNELSINHQCLLIDAWSLHNIHPTDIDQEFHLLAHHPIALDQTIIGDHEKEVQFWSKAKSIITTSNYVRNYIREFCNTPVYSVLPGINKSSERKIYPKLPDKINGFGSVIERKGDLLLIDSMHNITGLTIRRYGPQPDSSFFSKAKNYAGQLINSKLIFEGLLSESEKELCIVNTDLAIFPTHYESYGMAIQECLNANIPVLASDTEGMKERFGNIGIRYIKQEANLWTLALQEFCFNPDSYATICEEVKSIKNDFSSWNNQAEKIINHLSK